jgi:predicted neutral ceramidase superfamily lipid hydrolase
MKNQSRSSFRPLRIIYLVTIIMFLFARPAYAYADPGTGGLLYMIIVASAAIIGSYLAFFKDYVKRLFKREPGKDSDDEDQQG